MTEPHSTTTLEGRIVTATGVIEHGRLTLNGETIESVEALDSTPEPGAPTFVPGFVDIHNHGGFGGAFPTGSTEDCRKAAAYHLSRGTTTLVASLVSATEEEITAQVERLAPLVDDGTIDGIHLEGPFINPCRCGAQAPSRIQEGDPEMFARILEAAGGRVKSITLAPETAHLPELLELCARYRVIASYGHSDADAPTTHAALAAARESGAVVTATHLFNAMPQIHHRDPGIAAAMINAAADGTAAAELVADGVHLADETVDFVVASAPEHSFAVTDSMEAAGLPDGAYRLGPLEVTVAEGVARLTEGGAIAGGTSTLYDQYLRFAARHGEVAAVRFTATNATEVFAKVSDSLLGGDLVPGARADIVALHPNNQIAAVYHRGKEVSLT
ncbi:N-acetylglucosamine-6-phosphate deacetylase [Corynebacterium uterequi]|uniref:N-acetylglucosamine-6-phosphate deacetylase n=1 Tax=Corynebacterium uterequi TaxID=1072256 RepID=A0A0G3HGG7_9CORY|nr:amidohydrolase family protein [Corynebacterium uterequi]AKK11845.1 N-acetylglucosamine-6-phosphate deacetylase [Corynebacterium uterequi]